MYDELVKELRDSAEWADRLALLMGRAEGDAHAPIMRKAADAIEELQARIDLAVGLYNKNVKKTAMYEALIGISPEPQKEES